MIQKIKHIFLGWWLFVTSDKKTKGLSEIRSKVCDQCFFKDKALNTCKECGCFLPAKTRVKTAECPKGFWKV